MDKLNLLLDEFAEAKCDLKQIHRDRIYAGDRYDKSDYERDVKDAEEVVYQRRQKILQLFLERK